MRGGTSRPIRRLGPLILAAIAVALNGCLGEPEIEDRWTRVDLVSTSLDGSGSIPVGSAVPISLRASVTYRSILTGAVIAEVRVSPTVRPGDVEIDPDAPRLEMAHDIANLLVNSTSAGMAVRQVTGWTHLIQEIDLAFDAAIPSATDSSGAFLSAFLVTYLGEAEEIELEDGSDSLVVTPFDVDDMEVLPVGVELTVGSTRGARR